jgi:hypothetical protein
MCIFFMGLVRFLCLSSSNLIFGISFVFLVCFDYFDSGLEMILLELLFFLFKQQKLWFIQEF